MVGVSTMWGMILKDRSFRVTEEPTGPQSNTMEALEKGGVHGMQSEVTGA